MRTAYCEMKRGGLTVERRSRRSRTEAQRRKLVRVRENIGAAMMLLGFLLLMVIGGAEDLTVIFLVIIVFVNGSFTSTIVGIIPKKMMFDKTASPEKRMYRKPNTRQAKINNGTFRIVINRLILKLGSTA